MGGYVQLMKVGAKYKLFIPAEPAYGDRLRAGPVIGPNSTLIFDLNLPGIVAHITPLLIE